MQVASGRAVIAFANGSEILATGQIWRAKPREWPHRAERVLLKVRGDGKQGECSGHREMEATNGAVLTRERNDVDKLTEAKEYQKEADIAVAEMGKAWVVMGGMQKVR